MAQGQNFTPLNDLLSKDHESRVQDYLEKMEGMSVEEIVGGTALLKLKNNPKKNVAVAEGGETDLPFGTPKQLAIVE